MRKKIPSALQQSTVIGGFLNLIPMTYKISDTPIGDVKLYGLLAHVTDATRKKIMAAGFGEMELHLQHIAKSVGYIKKTRQKIPKVQLGFDLGD